MALSETAVRQVRITGIDYTIGDSDGLTLNVTMPGGRVWLFRYYGLGKQRRMSLGPSSPKASIRMSIVSRSGVLIFDAENFFAQHIQSLEPFGSTRSTSHLSRRVSR